MESKDEEMTKMNDGTTTPENRSCKTKSKRCTKILLAFLLSYIGLVGLVVGYSMLGGLVFMYLESENELEVKKIVNTQRAHSAEQLWDFTMNFNVLDKKSWMNAADDILKQFQTEIYISVKERGWDGVDSPKEQQWTYTGSLLYAVTTITTIGYGNIAPKTSWGRGITIVYAIIGIPITLLCLANVGGLLGKLLKIIYSRVCCGLCRWQRRKRALQADTPLNDNIQPETDEVPRTAPAEAPTTVPITLTMIVMLAYILAGALLFTLWEENWGFLDGFYFCFVTLSTIGFGDLVPGSSLNSLSSHSKFVLCSLYLLFGLALLAMCFDLVQEQVRHGCAAIGRCLGITDDNKAETNNVQRKAEP